MHLNALRLPNVRSMQSDGTNVLLGIGPFSDDAVLVDHHVDRVAIPVKLMGEHTSYRSLIRF